MQAYTVVITSCGRFDLLERTLASLAPCLEGPLDSVIVIEDSGHSEVIDVVHSVIPDAQVLVNDQRLGQLASIDRAYAHVRTPYIFHCEDDWLFTTGGFLQESYELLEAIPALSLVSLRPRSELNRLVRFAPRQQHGTIAYFQADPKSHPEYFGYSFNPGLRRRSDYLRVGPFTSFRGEREISYCFKKLGYTMGYLEDACVTHIGDSRHVDDPQTHQRARTLPQRLAHSARLRIDRLHRAVIPAHDPAVQIRRGTGEFARSRLAKGSQTPTEDGGSSSRGTLLPISCYVRTLNEERRIGEVLSHAKLLCEQVVVVDSGSTDATVQIARSHGAEVVHQQWLGNGHQKRVGESHCRHEWLLDLDADELLSLELIDEIRSEFAAAGPTCDVYQLALTIVDPTGRIWRRSGVSYRAKLYNRRAAQMPSERAWDQLVLGPEVKVRRLESPLLHYAFTDIGHLVRKQEAAMRNRVTGMEQRSRLDVQLRVALGFPCYFLKYYLVRGLWRQGLYGLCFSLACAFSRWGRDVKLYERDWLPSKSAATPARCSALLSSDRSPQELNEERHAA